MNAALQQLAAMVRRSPLAAFSLTLLLVLGVANYYLWERQQALDQEHTDVKRSGEAMLLALTGHARISAELAKVQEALKVIDRNLVVEGDLAENLGYFYQMETVGHVRLSQLNQLNSQPAPDGNPYKAVPFNLRATGTYAQLMAFVREMETGPRLLRIKSYTFSRGEGKGGALLLDLTVELLASP